MMKVLLATGTFAGLLQYVLSMNFQYLMTQCDGPTVPVDFYHQVRVQLSTDPTIASNTKCQVTIYTDTTYKFMVYFREMNIPDNSGVCHSNALAVYDGYGTTSNSLLHPSDLCGHSAPNGVYTTAGNALTFRFHSGFNNISASFDIIITPYHTGSCGSSEFSCSNGRCIDDTLTCSGYNPCGDNSNCNIPISAADVAAVAVGAVVVIMFITGISIVLRRRRRKVSILTRPMVVATTAVVNEVTPPSNPKYGAIQPASSIYP